MLSNSSCIGACAGCAGSVRGQTITLPLKQVLAGRFRQVRTLTILHIIRASRGDC